MTMKMTMKRVELKRREAIPCLGQGHDDLREEILKDENIFEAELILPQEEGVYYVERAVRLNGVMAQNELLLSLRKRPDELRRFVYIYAPIMCAIEAVFVKSGWKIKGGDVAFIVRYGIVAAMLNGREDDKQAALRYVQKEYGRLTEAGILANPDTGVLFKIILLKEILHYDVERIKALIEPSQENFKALLMAYFLLFDHDERRGGQ